MPSIDWNILAIIVAFIINIAVGSIWYSLPVFGKKWGEYKGVNMEDLNNAGSAMALSLIGGIVSAVLIYYIYQVISPDTLIHAIGVGSILAILASTTTFNVIVFDNPKGFGNRLKYWCIDLGNTWVTYTVISIAFCLWF